MPQLDCWLKRNVPGLDLDPTVPLSGSDCFDVTNEKHVTSQNINALSGNFIFYVDTVDR